MYLQITSAKDGKHTSEVFDGYFVEVDDSVIPNITEEGMKALDFSTSEKPYRPLVNIRHYGQNSHWSGRGQR